MLPGSGYEVRVHEIGNSAGVGSWKVVGDVVVVLLLASVLRGIKDPEGKSPSIPENSPLPPPVDFVPGFGVGAKTDDISIWLGGGGSEIETWRSEVEA